MAPGDGICRSGCLPGRARTVIDIQRLAPQVYT